MTALLLDTHALLWWLAGGERLRPDARELIASPATTVVVSAATVWEIGIKQAKGKLERRGGLGELLSASGFEPLAITIEHSLRAAALPALHTDPFDRMLVAQAQIESLVLVTRDPAVARYDVQTLAA